MIRKSTAFTLIEVLVVIAIIAILAAILLPVFSSAKTSAKQAQCASHMSQISISLHAYAAEYNENWVCAELPSDIGPEFAPQQPWVGYDNNNGPLVNGFYGLSNQPAKHNARPGALDRYIKNTDVLKCPEQPSEWQLALALNLWNPGMDSPYYTTNPKAKGMEYGPSAMETSVWSDGQSVFIGAPSSMIERPQDTIVLWEHDFSAPVCNFLQMYDWYGSPPNTKDLLAHFHFLHRRGAVTLWADGHTRRMDYAELNRSMFSCRKDIY